MRRLKLAAWALVSLIILVAGWMTPGFVASPDDARDDLSGVTALPEPKVDGGARVLKYLREPAKSEDIEEVGKISFFDSRLYDEVVFASAVVTEGEKGVLLDPEDYWVKVDVPFGMWADDVSIIEIRLVTEERLGGMVTWEYEGVSRRRAFSKNSPVSDEIVEVPVSADRNWRGNPERIMIQFRGLKKPMELISIRFLHKEQQSEKAVDLRGRTLLSKEVRPGEEFQWEVEVPKEETFLMFARGIQISAGGGSGAVEYSVDVEEGKSSDNLFRRRVAFKDVPRDAGWNQERVSLGKYKGDKIRLTFRAAESEDIPETTKYRILWGNPQIVRPADREAFNVVLIGIDTLRRDHLSCYGFRHPTSPRIDQLAREGAIFYNASSTSPWTLPSFASVLTGHFPSTHGAGKRIGKQRKGGEPPTAALKKGVPLLPEILKTEAGFRTAFFHNNPYLAPRYGLAPGFDYSEQVRGGGWKNLNRALGWLSNNLDQRSFLFLHLMEPHRPYMPPEPFKTAAMEWYAPERRRAQMEAKKEEKEEKEEKENKEEKKETTAERRRKKAENFPALYAGEVAYTDQLVGTFLDGLEDLGVLDNTLIIFTSDHGEEFKEHDEIERVHYNDPRGFWGAGHGHSQFEELVAAPLIMRFPGKIDAGTKVDDLAQIHDITPTILDFVGCAIPDGMSGLSLRPAIEGKGGRSYSFTEFILYGDDRTSYREGDWKLVFGSDVETCELYNLSEDPGERNNLKDNEPEILKHMITRLHEVEYEMVALGQELYPQKPEDEKSVEVDEETRKELKSLGYID